MDISLALTNVKVIQFGNKKCLSLRLNSKSVNPDCRSSSGKPFQKSGPASAKSRFQISTTYK